LSGAYERIARMRRMWYARPGRRRRLPHPVISVGNLSMGGSGKTPVVAALARLLRQRGERPVILTRGYGRRDTRERASHDLERTKKSAVHEQVDEEVVYANTFSRRFSRKVRPYSQHVPTMAHFRP